MPLISKNEQSVYLETQLQGKSVFVVEHNCELGEFIVKILKELKTYPVLCTDSVLAWAQVQSAVFPIVVLDLDLPDITGRELCKRLRGIEQYKDSLILVIIGNSEAEALQEVLAAGADDCIMVPVTAEMLKVRLEIMLANNHDKKLRQEAEDDVLMMDSLLEQRIAERTFELQQSKNVYRNILYNLSIGMIFISPECKVVELNPQMQSWMNYNKDPIGIHCHKVFDTCSENCVKCPVKACFDDGNIHSDIVTRVVDSESLFFSVRACPVCDNIGEVVNVIALVDDVTETIKRERELKKNLEIAQEHFTDRRLDQLCGLVGGSLAMNKVYAKIKSLLSARNTVLLQGETGTGKEMTALALHELSAWSESPFISVNCGSLPESILESELFGHTKGAFTGALGDKAGLFAAAGNGTIFLDEIEAASMHTQISLLRVLDRHEVYPIGGRAPEKIAARIVVASNQDLEEMVAKGLFREDLYYRICEDVIILPPLRDRTDDLEQLANYFLEQVDDGKLKRTLSPKVLSLLSNYCWPGNVREFRNLMKQLSRTATKSLIRPADLPEHYKRLIGQDLPTLAMHEKELIERVFLVTKGNKSDIARLLGISRNTVYSLLKKHNIL